MLPTTNARGPTLVHVPHTADRQSIGVIDLTLHIIGIVRVMIDTIEEAVDIVPLREASLLGTGDIHGEVTHGEVTHGVSHQNLRGVFLGLSPHRQGRAQGGATLSISPRRRKSSERSVSRGSSEPSKRVVSRDRSRIASASSRSVSRSVTPVSG